MSRVAEEQGAKILHAFRRNLGNMEKEILRGGGNKGNLEAEKLHKFCLLQNGI